MSFRALLSAGICVLCCSSGSAQQGAGAVTQGGRLKAPLVLDRKDALPSTLIKPRTAIADELAESPRSDLYGKLSHSVLKPQIRVGHHSSTEHGVAEAHANAILKALKIPVAMALSTSILVPSASDAECDKSQIAFGSVIDDNQDNIDQWGRAFNRTIVLPKADLQELIHAGKGSLLNLMSEYTQKCLSDVAQLRPDSPLRKNLSQTMGVLLVNSNTDKLSSTWGMVCSATRIGLNLVLTAKHCFYSLEAGQTAVTDQALTAIKYGRYKFRLPMLGRDLPVVSIECVEDQATSPDCRRYGPAGSRNAGFGADFVLLRVRDGDDLAIPNITVSSKGVIPGSPVMLAGWNLFASIVDAYRQSLTSPDRVKISLPLHLSRAGTCTIATVKNVCMVHTCQTSSGASGASLIQYDADGALRIIGLHVAPTDSYDKYMGKESCDIDLFRIHDLYQKSKQRYAGNIGLQLAP